MALSRCIVDLELRFVDGIGSGVFAIKDIAKGQHVIIFGGHIMTIGEEQRLQEFMRDLSLQITEHYVIGPMCEAEIGVADRVNHSCDPNCGFEGKIVLVAMRDIFSGEQITFDYCMTLFSSESKYIKDDSVYRIKCQCKPNYCRKEISSLDWIKEDLQSKYSNYFSDFVKNKIDEQCK